MTTSSSSTEPPTPCTPALSNPQNGKASCSDGNEVDSICRYSCDKGFYIEGTRATICRKRESAWFYQIQKQTFGVRLESVDLTPAWNLPPPSCHRSRCFTLKPFAHGAIDCSDGDMHGSVCKLSCDKGYELVGDVTTRCQEDVPGSRYGSWSTTNQYCESTTGLDVVSFTPDVKNNLWFLHSTVNHCVHEIAAPTNGSKSCTDGNNIDSVCGFNCASLFRMIGSHYLTCEKKDLYRFPVWSGESPACESNCINIIEANKI